MKKELLTERVRPDGYVMVKVGKEYKGKRSKDGWTFKHRLEMEKKLGRLLDGTEEIHHINGDKGDNRIENLMLFPNHGEHIRYHALNNGHWSYNRHVDTSKRSCFRCKSDTTAIQNPNPKFSNKTPYPLWKHVPWDKKNWYCNSCYWSLKKAYNKGIFPRDL